jgi:hypothetical protein
MGTDICNDDVTRQMVSIEQFQSRRGSTLNIPSAQNQSLSLDAPDNDLKPDSNWGNIDNDFTQLCGKPGKTALDFPFGPSLSQVLLSTISEGQNHNTGHLGVRQAKAAFPEALGNAGYASDGCMSIAYPRSGNIVLGGYDDRASARGSFTKFQINNNPALGNGYYCPLQVEIKQMEIGKSDGGVKTCIEP